MKKKLMIIPILIITILLLVLFTDYLTIAKVKNTKIDKTNNTINLDSSLFTKDEIKDDVLQDSVDFESDGFVLDLENSEAMLYSNLTSGAIRLVNKKTGYIWASDVLNIDQYDLNNAGIRQLQSAFTLVYRDKDDKVKQVRSKESKVTLSKRVSGNTIYFDAYHADSKISFSYQIALLNNQFTLHFDHQSIKENECRITAITFFPYLGSAYKETIPGYLFMPSGSGALIRFDQEPTISAVYQTPFYGEDANLVTNNEGDLLNLPAYGFVHGKNNALFVNIKEGATFAKLNYSPSSIDEGFHLLYPTFNYRETYQIKFSTSNVLMIPENIYPADIDITYTMLSNDDASYVGMAKTYQKELVNSNILTKQDKLEDDISLDLEVFGMDYEMGLILKKYYKMTTTSDILEFNAFLNKNHVNNIFYSLRAFNKNGYSAQSVTNYKMDHALGSLKDLEELEYYFYYNPIESYNSSKKYPSKVLVNLKNEKNYIKVGVNKYKFYANIKDVNKYLQKAVAYYEHLALDGIGYRLYGDHNNDLSKTDTYKLFKEILNNEKYPLYSPNYYMLKNTSKYLNMPLYSDRLRFFTDSVPFMEILLKGYIDYYSPYLNFSSNERMDVLKCIEYGCNPSYLVTKEESYLLADTLSSNYYATTFVNCADAIVSNYQEINNALKPVIGQAIINRKTIKVGVYLVTYENNYQIIVNYTDQDYQYLDHLIPSLGYWGGYDV